MKSPALLKLIKSIFVLTSIFGSCNFAYSQSQYINSTIRGQDSQFTYLGVCSSNAYRFDSILNVYGQYGSSTSSYSIRNSFSSFGSSFSAYSAYNSFAAYPPIIYNSAGIAQAYLTKNVLLSPRIDPDVLINYLSSLSGSGGVGTIAILMESAISYSTTGRTTGSTATLNVERINNYRASGTVSGTLALQLWATASEYISGTLNGYKLVEVPIGTSLGGYFYNKISVSGTLTAPPNGNYNMVMVLAEWNGSAYVTVDWGNFSNRTSFGITEIAPVIVTQPSSSTITSGGSVSFNASASGTPAPTYQWRKDGSLLAGATSSTYLISSATTSDAGSYTVVVTNSAGSATSNAATLTVTAAATAPTITTQPSSSSVTSGNAASFSVAASGTAPLTYQWRKDGTAISGATSSTYSIISAATSDAGSYTVVVTNSAGSATSNAATLTVTAAATAPTITTQPSSSSVTSGNAASFSVAASGTATLTYQWRKDGAAISGATSSTYSISSTSTSDAGSYTVVVTNSAGSATSNAATLTVTAAATAPAITTQPSASSVTAGSAASFSVAASGTAPLTYQWRKDGTAISGATSSTYSISSAATSDAGSYTVVVTNSAGSATSNAATLTVTAAATAPTITTQPSSSSVISGNAASFSVAASGTATLTYQWRKDGAAISGATSSTYSISSAATSDAGSYTVVVTNSAGSATSNAATLTVTAAATAPTITTQPSSSSVTAGSAASFSVAASGTAPLTYQWRKDGTAISGATSSTYSISSAATSDAGSYTVVVTNSVGSATSNAATLTVTAAATAPTITTQPSSSSVTAGSAASFSVAASGTAPLTYQWRKDGAAISGATSSTYSIGSAATSDAGSYTVVVTNSVGSATSNAATLTVTAAATAPTITTQPSSSSVTSGNAASFSVAASGTATLTYQWRKDGTAISGATSSTYSIGSAAANDAGSYTVVVTNSVGSATSNAATLTVTAAATAPRLYSLAVRTALEANQVLIVGFTMSGGAKDVLLRAAGPTLGAFGVPETMVDPKLDLYRGSTLITSNDNWGGSPSLAATFTSAGAFAYASATSLDAALVASIDGGRTAHVYGPGAGAVLVEGYDVGSGDAQRFTSLSARNRVGTGANILIAGFSLSGEGRRNLLIRAVGPTLGVFGVPSVLSDPKLEIYQGSTKIGENDNWAATLSTTFSSVGAFGLTQGSKDAAITVSLPAGGYTVQVSGADGGVGEALVEIYELP
jgi:hypothetical protein